MAATQGQVALLHPCDARSMRLLTGKKFGKKMSKVSREGRRAVQVQAAQRPNPGSKRKVSSNDLSRLSKIFGPSRYTTAYGPQEEELPPPPPPDASEASSSTSSSSSSTSDPRSSSAQHTAKAQEPPKEADSPAAAWAREVLLQQAEDGARGQAISREAQSLQQLVALSREPKARTLGPAALLAIADRAWAVATTQGIADEQELEDVQGLGEYLVLATHPHITAAAFNTSELALLLRTPLCLNHPPSAAWLKACEGSALRIMGLKAQQAAQHAQQGGDDVEQEMQGQRQMLASLVEEADGILAMSACFLACGFQPRPEFMAMFMDTSAGYMQLNEQQCLEAAQAMTRAAEGRKVGRRGGLIEVPEQLEVDEVLMADGSSYSAQVDKKSRDRAQEQQQQQQEQQQQTQRGAVTEEDLCVVNSFNWNAICEAVLRWGRNDAPPEWVQTFVDASYAAMRASLCVMAAEEDSSIDKVEVGRPLVTRVLDTNVIANIMTTAMYAFHASPGGEWLGTLCLLCQKVLEFVRENGGQDQESLEASGGIVANPAGLVNIFLLLRFVGYKPEAALVNAALGAVGKSYGGPALQQVPGDALATLMLEMGRHQYELDETARAAAIEFAMEAQNRWARALQERMNEEAKRRGRAVAAQQQQQQHQQEEVPGGEEGQQKEQEFTKIGMLAMLEGASLLGILRELPPEWMLLWGEEVIVMAEEFDAEDVIAGLAFAAKGGVSLSSPARTKLVGRLLEVAAPKPVPSSASISSTNTGGAGSRTERSSSMPSGAREMMSLDMLRDMMVALLMQADGSSLPGAWMPRMQALVEAHLPSMDPPDMVSALKLLGLLEIPPDETFLQHMVAAYTTALAREEPPKDGTEATASSILGSDEEACLELASGLAAASAPAPIMQVVEDASLHWSPDFSPNAHQPDAQPVQASSGVALEFWVGLLAKFAAGAYLPQQRWWQALAAATLGPVGSSTSSGGGDGTGMMLRSMTDAQLANLLAAYGALRAQHGPGVDQRGGGWAAQLALQAAHRLDSVTAPVASAAIPSAATSATLQSVVYLVGGLGTLFVLPIGPEAPLYPYVPRVCAAIEGATLTQEPLLSPSLVSACFAVFSPVAYTPGQAWLEAAGAAAARGLPSADGHDLATLLAACQAIPAFRTYMPTPVVNTLLRTAVQEGAAGGLQPSQMLSLINSAAGLHLDARVGAPHATQLRTLLDQAAGMRESFPPAGLAQLLKNAALMGAQPPGRWLDAMLSAFEGVDFLGPAFGGPEPLLQLLVALDAWDHHPLPPWLRLRLCEALPGVADMGVHAMRLLDKQQQRRLGRQGQGQDQQHSGQQQQQEAQQQQQGQQQQQQQQASQQQQNVLEMEIPVDGEEGEAMREAAQSACLQCSHAGVLLLQYLANTSPRSASASSTSRSSSSSPSSSGRTPVGRRAVSSSQGNSRTDGSGSDASVVAAGVPAHLLAPALSAFEQLIRGDCLPPADHAGLVYSLARLSPTKAAAEPARASSSTSSSSSEAAKVEGPAAAVAAARQGLLEALMPATAAALPSYSMLELVTIFSSFGALGAPLPPAWLDVFWEYSRPQLHACPVPMLAACLDAVASLKVRPAGAWEGALWSSLSSRASRLSLTDIDQLVAALSRAQLRPPEPLLQQLLEAALAAAGVPAASPETAQQMAANIPAASSDAGTRQEDVVGSTRTRRSERAAPATANNGSGSASSEDASAAALAAAQMGRRAVQLSRVLGVANRGMGYQPPSEWMNQFRGVAATALSSRQLPPQERSMLMDVMQATASMP